MLRCVSYAVLVAAIAVPSVLLATQGQQTTEARVAAYKHEDGRIEFAIQVREGSGWGERILPTGRFLSPTVSTGRWIPSTAVALAAPAIGEETLLADEDPEATSGHVGPLYEWRYGYENNELSRYRVEWTTANTNGNKHVLITVPDRNDHECDEDSPCRYELMFWCGADPSDIGLVVLLRKFWFLNNRVATWTLESGRQSTGWDYRKPAALHRIATSIDHEEFSGDWQVYLPRGQDREPSYYYGGDFVLEGKAAHSFMNRVIGRNSVSVTVRHEYSNDDTFEFDLSGALDNPAVRQLQQCR